MIITDEFLNSLPSKEREILRKIQLEYIGIDVGLTEIFQYILKNRIHDENNLYTLNSSLGYIGISIPTQSLVIERKTIEVKLAEFLLQLESVSANYTCYAYFSAKTALNLSHSSLKGITIQQVRPTIFNILIPNWLLSILNKQAQNQLNNGYLPHNKLFPKEDLESGLVQTYHSFEQKFWYSINTYIEEYNKFGISKTIVYSQLKSQKRVRLNGKYDNMVNYFVRYQKLDGFVVQKIEPGIYLVDTLEGLKIIPYHIIQYPSKKNNELYEKVVKYCEVIKPPNKSPMSVKLQVIKDKFDA